MRYIIVSSSLRRPIPSKAGILSRTIFFFPEDWSPGPVCFPLRVNDVLLRLVLPSLIFPPLSAPPRLFLSSISSSVSFTSHFPQVLSFPLYSVFFRVLFHQMKQSKTATEKSCCCVAPPASAAPSQRPRRVPTKPRIRVGEARRRERGSGDSRCESASWAFDNEHEHVTPQGS